MWKSGVCEHIFHIRPISQKFSTICAHLKIVENQKIAIIRGFWVFGCGKINFLVIFGDIFL